MASAGALRPGTRKIFVRTGVGRSYLISTNDSVDYGGGAASPSLRLEQSVGFHPKTKDSSGLSVAFVGQETINAVSAAGSLTEFGIGPRVGGDIALAPSFGAYLTPFAGLAYNLQRTASAGSPEMIVDSGIPGVPPTTVPAVEASSTFFSRVEIELGLEARFLVADRVSLSMRAIDLEIVTDFQTYSMRWNVMAGFGATF